MNKISRKNNSDFFVICNECLLNKNISEQTKGIYAIIMSLPQNFEFSVSKLIEISNGGKNVVIPSILELIEFGYCTRTIILNKDNQFDGVDYVFYENALPPSKRHKKDVKFPDMETKPISITTEISLTLSKEIIFCGNSNLKDYDLTHRSIEFVKYFKIADGFRNIFLKFAQDIGGTTRQLDEAKIKNWLPPIKELYEIDNIDGNKIKTIYELLQINNEKTNFWLKNISSTKTLRKQFNKLLALASEMQGIIPKKEEEKIEYIHYQNITTGGNGNIESSKYQEMINQGLVAGYHFKIIKTYRK